MALTSTSTDSEVMAQYEDNARYWESYAKASNFCEALTFILNRFNRMNVVAGKQWTREDLSKQFDKAEEKREALQPAGSAGARATFVRGRPR